MMMIYDARRREIHRDSPHRRSFDWMISSGIETNLFIGPAADWLAMARSSSTVMAVPEGRSSALPLMVVPSVLLLVLLFMPLLSRFAIIGALEQRFKGESTSIVSFTRRHRSHVCTWMGRLGGQGARDGIKMARMAIPDEIKMALFLTRLSARLPTHGGPFFTC